MQCGGLRGKHLSLYVITMMSYPKIIKNLVEDIKNKRRMDVLAAFSCMIWCLFRMRVAGHPT